MSTLPNPNQTPEDPIRPHTFDGIQEYDKRLPNWWLLTFYGAIAFSIVYWFYYAHTSLVPKPGAQIEAEMARIEAVKLASSSETLDDGSLWQMSRNAVFVDAGASTFKSTCSSCHGEQLGGGIGPSLVDKAWLHGGRPTDIVATVTNGVAAKGMPTWGPVLGTKKITEVVAFILSKHDPAEPEMSGTASASH
jgi:cytochrome c oxidase cbb3-type subunit III